MKAKVIKPLYYLLFFIMSTMHSGCYDKNFENISENINVTPEYSIPLGFSDILIDDIVNDNRWRLHPVNDTSDSMNIFVYDNLFYQNPITIRTFYTIDFDINSIVDQLDYVVSVMVRANCINSIPGKLSFQLYFVNNNVIVDSLYDKWVVIDAARTDNNGNVIPAESWKNDANLTESQINNLYNVGEIWLDTKLETSNYWENNVKYFSDQKSWFQVGIRINLDLPLNEYQNKTN